MLALLPLLLLLGCPSAQERPRPPAPAPVRELPSAQVARWTRSLSVELSLRPTQQVEVRRILEEELTLRASQEAKGSLVKKGKGAASRGGTVPPARPARPVKAGASRTGSSQAAPAQSRPSRPEGVAGFETSTLGRILALLDARQSRRYVELLGPKVMARLRTLGKRRSQAWAQAPKGPSKGGPAKAGKAGRGRRGGRRRLF